MLGAFWNVLLTKKMQAKIKQNKFWNCLFMFENQAKATNKSSDYWASVSKILRAGDANCNKISEINT